MKKRKRESARTLEDWIALINSRGMAGIFASKTQSDQQVIELAVAQEFQRSLATCFGIEVTEVKRPSSDPPDFLCKINRHLKSVEITELMNSDFHRKYATSVREKGSYNAHGGKGFKDSHWTKDLFFKRLNHRIESKDTSYRKRQLSFDILLICSAEKWLLPEEVDKWVEGLTFAQPKSFKAVVLLLEYDPKWNAECWPVFHIVGEKLA